MPKKGMFLELEYLQYGIKHISKIILLLICVVLYLGPEQFSITVNYATAIRQVRSTSQKKM